MSAYNEEALLRQWQAGSESAFTAIYLHHVLPLLRLATAKLGSRAVAEELVQDTFLALVDQRAQLDPTLGVGGYLAVLLRRKIYNHYRQTLLQASYQTHLRIHFNEHSRDTEASLELTEIERLVQEGVRKLPQQCRSVYQLSREEHLSHQEIAERLGISYHTVEQHIRRALRGLRQQLPGYSWLLALCCCVKNLGS